MNTFVDNPRCPKCHSYNVAYRYMKKTTVHPNTADEVAEYLALNCRRCEHSWQMEVAE